MEDNKLQEKKNIILALMSDKAYRPMKFKEMAGLLQVPKEERDNLRLVLEDLIRDGKAELSINGRYQLVNANLRTGTFSGTTRGFGFVLIDGEPDVFIGEADTKGARDKDKVQIAIKGEGKTWQFCCVRMVCFR